MAHVSVKKKKEVEELKKLIKKYKVFGIIDLTNLPSAQMQSLRAKLKNSLLIRTSKKRLFKIVFNAVKEDKSNIDQLLPKLENCMPALIFSNEDPFKIAALLERNKSSAPAKEGNISPSDLIIPAGPTPFTPGPIIGELGQMKIKAMVEGGKIVIREDTLIAKKGEVISAKVADLLTKLGIEPMEIGINLIAVYDNGNIYNKESLYIDPEIVINEIKRFALDSFSLAVNINYISKETIELLIKKAYLESLSLKNYKSDISEAVDNIKLEDKTDKEKKMEKFKEEEKVADDILKKLQDEKIQKGRT